MTSIKKNVSQADKDRLVQSDLANLKSNQVRARKGIDDVLSEKEVIAEGDISETKEVDFAAPRTTEDMVDRPMLLAQIDGVVESEKFDDDKGLLLFKDSLPVGFSEASSVSAGAAAGAANNGLSWLPIAGALGAIGVLASTNKGTTSVDNSHHLVDTAAPGVPKWRSPRPRAYKTAPSMQGMCSL